MTTIATDGKSMASDGRTTGGNTVINDAAVKIHTLPDGSLIGAAGASDRWPEAVAELSRSIEAGDLPAEMRGDYELLRLLPNGKAIAYAERLRPHPVSLPASIGSGSDFALGAMAAGADLKAAIKIAAKLDPHTGGRTRIVSLRHRERRPSRRSHKAPRT
jgi:ATP-dependent protease HslVU (ClpYQ) peptidase subunit